MTPWPFDQPADTDSEPEAMPALQTELIRRKNYLRRLHAGQQPKRPPHRSYFRLGLLVEADGRYMLTNKAVELYINAE